MKRDSCFYSFECPRKETKPNEAIKLNTFIINWITKK